MKTDLRAFLRRLAGTPFSHGEDGTDCGRPLADLWMSEHGVDPIARWRVHFSMASRGAVSIDTIGQFPRRIAFIAREAGAKRRSGSYQPGDLAVVRIGRQWFGAIRSDDGYWIIKAHDGVLAMRDCRVVAAWSLT